MKSGRRLRTVIKEEQHDKVDHISCEQMERMTGPDLLNELWTDGMMNELRRYPNEIPCSDGEIPSMLIPKCSGRDKVEWGFAAGMSCIVPKGPGKAEIRNAEHFPASATLALLDLWHKAGAMDGLIIKTTLYSAVFIKQ